MQCNRNWVSTWASEEIYWIPLFLSLCCILACESFLFGRKKGKIKLLERELEKATFLWMHVNGISNHLSESYSWKFRKDALLMCLSCVYIFYMVMNSLFCTFWDRGWISIISWLFISFSCNVHWSNFNYSHSLGIYKHLYAFCVIIARGV